MGEIAILLYRNIFVLKFLLIYIIRYYSIDVKTYLYIMFNIEIFLYMFNIQNKIYIEIFAYFNIYFYICSRKYINTSIQI
jgi:hypothetical protein